MWYVVCLFIGAFIGMVIMAICVITDTDDDLYVEDNYFDGTVFTKEEIEYIKMLVSESKSSLDDICTDRKPNVDWADEKKVADEYKLIDTIINKLDE